MTDLPPSTDVDTLPEPGRFAERLRKLHSLTGVVPVGLFVVVHLWVNARALRGQNAFDSAVGDIHRVPLLPLFELAILVPLLFHAAYGIKLSFEGLPNLKTDPSTKNWLYVLQRVSGVAALVFITYHLFQLRYQKLIGATNIEAYYATLCAELSSTTMGVPWVALLYLIGIAACAFHLANGMLGFASSWGITTTPRSQQIAAVSFGLLGLLLFLIGADTTLFFATGTKFFVL